jgi:Transcription factor WhiB
MSLSPTPIAGPLPCRENPDRWFNRGSRTHALRACLGCPARRWCAGQALRERPSWGLWAGVWIDGDIDKVADYLTAIATAPTPAPTPRDADIRPTPLPLRPRVVPPPWSGGVRVGPRGGRTSVRAALLARSSGHCEIMVAGCGLSADLVGSRVGSLSTAEPDSPALAYVSCGCCAEALTGVDPRMARRLGYAGLTRVDAAVRPFLWRQARWVRFDMAGGMHEATAAADTA